MEKDVILRYASMLADKIKDTGNYKLYDLFRYSEFSFYESRYDNWNYGTRFYTFEMIIQFSKYKTINVEEKSKFESIIKSILADIFDDTNDILEEVKILPKIEQIIDWNKLNGIANKEQFIQFVINEKDMLINVSTGKIKIQDCDNEYQRNHLLINKLCGKLGIESPTNYGSCWNWYNFYKDNLKTYQDRRTYINEKYLSYIEMLSKSNDNTFISIPKTGFILIDESIRSLQDDINSIKDRISINAIGVRCRETLIMLAKEIYDDSKHHPSSYPDTISSTDSKRMIEGFIEHELGGQSNEVKRKYAKSTNDLANDLTHKQMATVKDAKLCVSATFSLIEMIKIILE